MGRNKRSVRHAPSTTQPPTPGSGTRDTRASSIFPYSVARPPTDFASPPVPESVKTSIVSVGPSARDPVINDVAEEEEEEEDETIIDPRETPLYARSDWGATTGTRTAWSRSSYPDFEDEVGPGQGQRRTTELQGTGAATNTVWSKSSYDSDSSDEAEDVDAPVGEAGKAQPPETAGDPYTGQAPTTAWSQESYADHADQGPPPVPPVRDSQIGTVALTPTALPPSYTIPLTPKGSKRSRQSVHNKGYSTALKSAGSRKPSQLVDITELSEGTQSPSTSSINNHHHQVENPFSPMFANANVNATEAEQPPHGGKGAHHRDRSTLPSIVDLETLAARPRPAPKPPTRNIGQGDDDDNDSPYSLEPPRFGRVGTDSPRLLTPEAQNRLGRMSVATARYSLPPSRDRTRGGSSNSRTSDPSSARTPSRRSIEQGTKKRFATFKASGPVRWYTTWRPFLTAGHALMAALLMTIALADENSGLGWLIKIQAGGLATMPADGGFGLGTSGWCQLDEDEVCSAYTTDDFASADGVFTVPKNATIDRLYLLWIALTTILWFQALFALSAAFLHFYLFYILAIPFDHLVRAGEREDEVEKQGGKEDQVQKEVDIRARCERAPFEEYIWVWWAWWAFRRSPVAHLYAALVGGIALTSTGLTFMFRNAAVESAAEGSVSFGFGAFLPLVALLMVLDTVLCALYYFFIAPRRSLNTFLNPPEPTPAAILLPPSEKPLALRRRSGVSTFFAAPTTARMTRANRTLFDADAPAMPAISPDGPAGGGELDEETRRWLTQYPQDRELVPLIAALRQGAQNDDFVLSEVGLLYLRPDDHDPTATALLVPPSGLIRRELLEDAHIDEHGTHKAYEDMLDELERVFWWVGMEQDIETHVARCAMCPAGPGAGNMNVTEESKSMYTGTGTATDGGEGAAAADMAIAMRKAKEDAERPWAG